ncbi:BQ5605_C006g03772 [Microbotryum silenes-dioicae]|uniref:BQ5605_C006g03772 protein n=1 Tax=Microbotryum silenes-dioicae TaxID=796604 RepID=A0A2X0P7L0_9BASI|nr:BQ5605_C006g03772 [Microbotryum silenes-dioicae]
MSDERASSRPNATTEQVERVATTPADEEVYLRHDSFARSLLPLMQLRGAPADSASATDGQRPATSRVRPLQSLQALRAPVVETASPLASPTHVVVPQRVMGAVGRFDSSFSRATKPESNAPAATRGHASPISSRAGLFQSNALTDRADLRPYAKSMMHGSHIPISGRIPRPPSPTVNWDGEGHDGTLEQWSPRKVKSRALMGFAARATLLFSSTRTANVLWQHSIAHNRTGVGLAQSIQDVARPSLCLRVLSVLPDNDPREMPSSLARPPTTSARIGGKRSVLLHCRLSFTPIHAQSDRYHDATCDIQDGFVLLSVLDSPANSTCVGEIVPLPSDLVGQQTTTTATSNGFVPTGTADLSRIQAGCDVWVLQPYHHVEIVRVDSHSDVKRINLICTRFLVAT